MKELPPKGVLAHWHEYPGAFIQAAVSTTLPEAVPRDGVEAFEWRGDDEVEDGEGDYIAQPFYTWGDEDEEST